MRDRWICNVLCLYGWLSGETLLSPLVMCGPHGTQFLKPVELRLPHCASMTPDGWSFALKSSDTPTGTCRSAARPRVVSLLIYRSRSGLKFRSRSLDQAVPWPGVTVLDITMYSHNDPEINTVQVYIVVGKLSMWACKMLGVTCDGLASY